MHDGTKKVIVYYKMEYPGGQKTLKEGLPMIESKANSITFGGWLTRKQRRGQTPKVFLPTAKDIYFHEGYLMTPRICIAKEKNIHTLVASGNQTCNLRLQVKQTYHYTAMTFF